jgi:hypothetical protein
MIDLITGSPLSCRNGLREVPTFVLNMMTQWGNLLIYMKMPDWVEDLGPSIVESEDDPDDVKALKVRKTYSNVAFLAR